MCVTAEHLTYAWTDVCFVPLQDFDIDLEGAQMLRILCYKKENESSILIGKGAFEVYFFFDGIIS